MKILNKFIEVQEVARRVFATLSTGSVSVDTSQTALPSDLVPRGSSVLVRADPTNTDYVMVGGSSESSLDFKLEAGASVSLAESNVDNISAKSNSGTQVVRYIMEKDS